MSNGNVCSNLEYALHQMQAQAASFGRSFIQDAAVRGQYNSNIAKAVRDIRAAVANGQITPGQGAARANQIRNELMDLARSRSSAMGRARAQALKSQGKTLEELIEKYAQQRFKRPASTLSKIQRAQVMDDVIGAAGRANPKVNAAMTRASRLGKGLLFVSIGIAVFNVYHAEDKTIALVKEGTILGGGILGGMAGGAAAGLVCGPGAPVCSTIGVVVGGAVFALGIDYLW